MLRSLLAIVIAALIAPLAHAASSGQLVSPQIVSVLGGDSRVFTVRFFDALGQPAVGETVHWANDVCGTFSGGGFTATTTTDATGTASVTFTAMQPAGITCWLQAVAGVALQFNVLTYQLNTVHFTVEVSGNAGDGSPYILNVNAMQGAYHLYEADVSASIVAGTTTATISPSTQNTGQLGRLQFNVTPAGTGVYDVVIGHRGVTQHFVMGLQPNMWQDMWWGGPAENGWGMSVAQHGDKLFSVIYAYDSAGKPTWYVMPAGTWDSTHSAFNGQLYHPTGSPYTAYDTSKFVPGAPVGNATITFTGYGTAAIDYAISGSSGHESITRQSFGAADPSFTASYGDMWWGGAAQNGWGIALLQQGHSIFGVWFTYDDAGAPTWLVMPSGSWSDANTWTGHVYRTTGSPWVGRTYDPNMLNVSDVGTFSVRFDASGAAAFSYTIDGRAGSLSLVRQGF